jgi:pSer/pThr/pTyr-binding forkhead associated (FHA) protein
MVKSDFIRRKRQRDCRLMRIVLEIRGGAANGRKIWLLSGQTVTVGRSSSVDFAVSEDPRISGRHFQIQCGDDTCHLKDLNSTNGTLVNGTAVRESPLRDGDEVLAGQTRFVVSIVTDRADASLRALPESVELNADDVASESNSPAPQPAAGSADGRSRVEPLPMLVLNAESPGAIRRRIWLRPESDITFGRSAAADQMFPSDVNMSGRHFLMEPAAQGWRCRDLGSTNGTFLNGVLIAEAMVQRGDVIRAGGSTFAVDMPHAGGQPAPAAKTQESTLSPNPAASGRRALLRAPLPCELLFRRFECRSGLVLYLGQRGGFDPTVVARLLAGDKPPLFVIDQTLADKTLGTEGAPATLASYVPLAMQGSPRVVVCGAPAEEWMALVQAAWGQDSLAVALAASDVPSAIETIGAFSKKVAASSPTSRLAGLYPSQLVEQLANAEPGERNGLFPALRCVLVEAHQGDRWAILGPPDTGDFLVLAGLRESPAWE